MGFCLYNNAALAARAAQQYVEKKQHLDRLRFEQQQQKKKKSRSKRRKFHRSRSRRRGRRHRPVRARSHRRRLRRGGALFGQGQGKLRSRPSFRVMILDWDVHHGNGTQAMFEDDPTVS